MNNEGGTCGYREPPWINLIANSKHPIRPAARAMQGLSALHSYENGKDRPYLHLVVGGVPDNLAMRGMFDVFNEVEALRLIGQRTRLDHIQRILVAVVNSLVEADDRVGQAVDCTRHVRRADADYRGADRSPFVRGGRASAGHRGKI
ncbi:MAG: hypothetical protein ABI593_07105 [Betaproteobacteria bacterium]